MLIKFHCFFPLDSNVVASLVKSAILKPRVQYSRNWALLS